MRLMRLLRRLLVLGCTVLHFAVEKQCRWREEHQAILLDSSALARSIFRLRVSNNAGQPRIGAGESGRLHALRLERALGDAAALRLTGDQPCAGDNPHIAGERMLAAGRNFRAALHVTASAGHDEVCAALVKVGGEGGAEGEKGGYEELALRDCDS
jgi:hypothetical protein